MTLENRDEFARNKLQMIIDLTNKMEENNCCDWQLITAANREIETLMKELCNRLNYLEQIYG